MMIMMVMVMVPRACMPMLAVARCRRALSRYPAPFCLSCCAVQKLPNKKANNTFYDAFETLCQKAVAAANKKVDTTTIREVSNRLTHAGGDVGAAIEWVGPLLPGTIFTAAPCVSMTFAGHVFLHETTWFKARGCAGKPQPETIFPVFVVFWSLGVRVRFRLANIPILRPLFICIRRLVLRGSFKVFFYSATGTYSLFGFAIARLEKETHQVLLIASCRYYFL